MMAHVMHRLAAMMHRFLVVMGAMGLRVRVVRLRGSVPTAALGERRGRRS
jgi:hypothetical protein